MESHHFLEIIIGVCAVLAAASALYAVSKKVPFLPFTFLLFLAGTLLAPPIALLEPIRLNPGMVMYLFLPILLFESAYNFEFHNFRKILVPGFWLASVGLLISAAIIALAINVFLDVPFLHALLFGCVISSTDPIAVLTIFKQLGVPRKLQLLVDGESFLNDATSVIAFRIILAVVGTGAAADFGAAEVGQSFFSFVVVLFGGAVVGVTLGYLATRLIKRLQDMAPVELTITIIMAHAVFIIADHFLKVSGIIAVLGAGVVLGNYGHDQLSKKAQADMHVLWDYLVFLTVSLVFFLVGYEIVLPDLWHDRYPILLGAAALLVGRAVSVYLVGGLYNLSVKKAKRIPLNWLHVANWGGLRGVLPLVVILSLPESFAYRELFLDLVLGAILFTLTVNALSIPALIKWLGLSESGKQPEESDHEPKAKRLFHFRKAHELHSRP